MNIFIVGPMGSGKSTVGKIISDELFLNFFDTDDEIEARTGASIDWIFDLEGEDGFRKRESEMLEEMVKKFSESNRWLAPESSSFPTFFSPIYFSTQKCSSSNNYRFAG